MLGVTFQNRGAGADGIEFPVRVRAKRKKVILGSPRSRGVGGRQFARRPAIGLVVPRSDVHHPSVPALKRICDSWGFRLGLCGYRLRQRARQRAALLVIFGCATTIGWGLGLLP
jgi:hypothetical protein